MDQMHTHGGGEKILSSKMNSLVNDFGCEVYLCTSEQDGKPSVYAISKEINWLDLGINYRRNKSYFSPLNLIKTIQHFLKLKKALFKIKPDVIISVSYSPEQYFLPFIHKNIPKVKEIHSSGVNYKRPIGLIQKLKYQLFGLFENYNAVVVLNNDEEQYYPFKNVLVIPNFIEKSLNNIQKKNTIRKNIIIAAGRIAPVKQFDHLIKAWSLIAKDFPDWKVQIYGEGDEPLLSELDTLIKEQSVPNIQLMGATNNLGKKMEEAAIYALTSATECFPMVLLESLACGLPIVSYDCPHGPSNIVTNGEDGILVEHNSIECFAENLTKLIIDEELRMKMERSAVINSKRFEEDVIMMQWINLFKK